MSERALRDGRPNPYTAFLEAVAECYGPLVRPGYAIALARYNAGDDPYPPCERCCEPMPLAAFTGAMECDDCGLDAPEADDD